MSFEAALTKAKINMVSVTESPFLAYIMMALKIKEDNTQPTAYVDGVYMGINSTYFLSLTPEVRVSLLKHECWHLALDHITALVSRSFDRNVWNKATDFVINRTIKDSGKPLGTGWLYDSQYDGMTEIQIYNELMKDPKNQKEDPDINHFGSPKDANGNPINKDVAEQMIKKIIIDAATYAKAKGEDLKKTAGSMSGTLDFILESIKEPKVDWRTLLMQYLTSTAKNDYSYKRPNKRYLPHNLILPTLYSEAMGEVYCFMDLSGSVDDKQAGSMLGQLQLMQRSMQPEKMMLCTFDTEIMNEYDVTHLDMSTLSFKGRGGTSLSCVFEYLKDKQPALVIIMSDFDCNLNYDKPSYPVVCVGVDTYTNPTITFGTYVEYQS